MARHLTKMQRRFDLKPIAFAATNALTGHFPATRRMASFYPDLGWPQESRTDLRHASVHRFALNDPRHAQALAAVSTDNVDTFDMSGKFTSYDEGIRACAIINDVIIPGHTITPADIHTGRQIAYDREAPSRWPFAYPALCAMKEIKVSELCIAIPPYRHYGHLLTDMLMPLVFALHLGIVAKGEKLCVVIARNPNPLVKGFIAGLSALGFDVRTVELSLFEHVVADRFLYARTHCRNVERVFAVPEALPLAKELFTAAYRDRSLSDPAKRLYIKRARAKLRNVEGEDELIAGLEQRGFRIFEPQWSNHHEQVHLCSHADVIIGVHGATLANLLFARPGSLAIEIMSHDGRKSTGLHWAAETGMDYEPVFGSPETAKQAFAIDPAKMLGEIDALIDKR